MAATGWAALIRPIRDWDGLTDSMSPELSSRARRVMRDGVNTVVVLTADDGEHRVSCDHATVTPEGLLICLSARGHWLASFAAGHWQSFTLELEADDHLGCVVER
jgi:hypothetical protein